jgi:uncharacterized protein
MRQRAATMRPHCGSGVHLPNKAMPSFKTSWGRCTGKVTGALQDYAAAMSWYQKAADQGNAPAQFNVGFMYFNGLGVPQDYAAAMSWYRKAADQGNSAAQLNLGVMYLQGEGAPQDYVSAYMWFDLAAAAVPAVEFPNVAAYRDEVAEKMTPGQVAEAQRLAREWKPK